MPSSHHTLSLLRLFESPNVTFQERDGSWPIVWDRARGVHVWDVDGRHYLDLTAGFGVAAAGHANARVIQAARRQMTKLLHAMGDVHPHPLKAELARELSRITFERWTRNRRAARLRGKTIFCNSGFEAVEAALKTALLATGRPGVIAFRGGYHGLGYGALNATHREHFRAPFQIQLAEFGQFVPFPQRADDLDMLEKAIERRFSRSAVGAILVEPIQDRGGLNVPPPGFLPLLRRVCHRHRALLVLDEVFTGFGRTGAWFACEQSGTIPDLICLGKALTGGFPLSACVGMAAVMDRAWPKSTGEAIHTSTYLGHPVGCAMALAQIKEIRTHRLVQRSAALGRGLLKELESAFFGNDEAERPTPRRSSGRGSLKPAERRIQGRKGTWQICLRGCGLMVGIEIRHADGTPATAFALTVVKSMLRRGFIVLPEGEHSNVISLTPPLTMSPGQLRQTARALAEEVSRR